MQNKKRKRPTTGGRHNNQRGGSKKKVRFEDLLEDDGFDDEDYDTVTGDTLEFLSLDDDVIEAYQKEKASKASRGRKSTKKSVSVSKRRPARYVEEDYEDEDYEDDEDEIIYEDEEDDEVIYEEEDDEDEAAYEDDEDEIVYEDDEIDYEDEDDYGDEDDEDEADYGDEEDDEDEADYGDEDEEDYEDDDDEVDYEDEEYYEDDYYEDEEDDDGFGARLTHFIREMNGLDMAVAVLGILVLLGAVITGGIYVHAKSTAKQVASFSTVGEEIEGVSVIGESGLLAVSESAKLGNMIDVDGEDPEGQETKEEEEDENGEVTVELRLTSILSDIKIKFVNKKSGKLIGGVPFEVEVSGAKSYNLKDDDKDGVIYQTDVAAGNYEVRILPLSGEDAEKYKLPSGSSSVKVTDKIAYEKVDVADEVKSESEINVAQEEANVQHTAVESSLQDTVEWVESTKTPIEGGGGDADYEQVPLDNIVDPYKTSSAFRKMVEGDGTSTGGESNDDKEPGGDTDPANPDKPDPDTPPDPVEPNPPVEPDPPVDPVDPKPEEPEKPTVKDVTVSKSGSDSLTLKEGDSQTLSLSFSDGKSYDVKWSSSNTSVAAVSGGKVTAAGAGSATITAEVQKAENVNFSQTSFSFSVTVTAKEVPKTEVTVSLNKTSMTLEAGKSDTLSVSGGSGYSVAWSSSNTSVVTVSGGTVTAKAAGSATITATVTGSGNVVVKNPNLTCSVTVTAAQNGQVEAKLNTTDLRIVKNQKAYLQIIDGGGKTYDAKTYATFEISDKSIADVHSDGQIKGLKDGTATIKVKLKSTKDVTFKNTELACKITVGEKNYTSVVISGKREVEVGIGQKLTLTAKSEPEGAVLVWKCTNEAIATVDKNGVVTGVKEGKTKIQVYCQENDKIGDEIKITVKKSVVDPAARLKDKNGNQLYYKKDGKYIEATYKDYKEHSHFYKLKASAYKYTGWQTIDGHLYYFDKNGNYVTGDQVIQGAKYTFGSDGKMSNSSGTMGIDVSKHNGNIDWNAVKNSGVSYVIIRCGYRGYSTGVLVEDPKFRSNIQGAKAAGLKVGAYFFSQAVNEVEAVEEASMAIDLVKGYGLNYPLFLDVEGSGGRADGISRDTRTAVCKTFCQTVQNSGIQAGVYANKTWFSEKINTGSLTSYKLWLAQYASAPTYTATRYDLWQYSSKGKVSGISGNVDMNISYVNY